MALRTQHRPGNIRVLIEIFVRLGNGSSGAVYADPVPAYARFSGNRSINLNANEGYVRTDAPSLTFASPVGVFGKILIGTGSAINLVMQSRITWQGRYYSVTRMLDVLDTVTGKYTDVTAVLSDMGAVPAVEVVVVVDDREGDQGVEHDIRGTNRPRAAVRGGTKR